MMNKQSIIYYALGLISLVIAVIIFLKRVDWITLVILVFGVAAVLLFRQGVVESRKK